MREGGRITYGISLERDTKDNRTCEQRIGGEITGL